MRILVSLHHYVMNDNIDMDKLTTLYIADPYIPYKATVSARTSVGEGEPSSVVFFTLEGGEDESLI